jgi:hypothetical protein
LKIVQLKKKLFTIFILFSSSFSFLQRPSFLDFGAGTGPAGPPLPLFADGSGIFFMSFPPSLLPEPEPLAPLPSFFDANATSIWVNNWSNVGRSAGITWMQL